jgi:hypothetical protein
MTSRGPFTATSSDRSWAPAGPRGRQPLPDEHEFARSGIGNDVTRSRFSPLPRRLLTESHGHLLGHVHRHPAAPEAEAA